MTRSLWLVRQIWSPILLTLVTLAAGTAAEPAAATDLSGCWNGHWESCTTGHQGPLNATFCQTCPTSYSVEFTGRFFKIVPFRYSVTLDVVSDDGTTVVLAGSSYLGRLAGTFSYQASATSTEFTANYSSCKDQGKFVLSRCCGSCGR